MVISRFTVPWKAFTLPVKPITQVEEAVFWSCYAWVVSAVHWWPLHKMFLPQLSFLDNAWGALNQMDINFEEERKIKKRHKQILNIYIARFITVQNDADCRVPEKMILNPAWLIVLYYYQKGVNILGFIWISHYNISLDLFYMQLRYKVFKLPFKLNIACKWKIGLKLMFENLRSWISKYFQNEPM